MNEDQPTRKPSGFAAMDPALAREISRKGGKSAHAKRVAHRFTHDEAVAAGRKGGAASQARRREAKVAPSKEEQ